MLGIISAKEAVFDEIAHGPAMGALSDFELGIEIFEFELGRANSAAHDKLSQHIAKISPELFECVQSRKIASATKPNRLQIRQNRGWVEAGYDV